MTSFINIAAYQESSEKTVREWIKSLDKASLDYLFNHLYKQTKVVKKQGKIVKVIRFGDVIKLLQDEYGVMSSGLTRSEYISHEASDIVMRAILGILEDKHLDREPNHPVSFKEFERFLLNDVAGSQLFKTNNHAVRYKYGPDVKSESEKRAISHINVSDAETLQKNEKDIAQSVGVHHDLVLEISDIRKLISGESEYLLKVFDLSLGNHSIQDMTKVLNKSKSKIYSDLEYIRDIIDDYQTMGVDI